MPMMAEAIRIMEENLAGAGISPEAARSITEVVMGRILQTDEIITVLERVSSDENAAAIADLAKRMKWKVRAGKLYDAYYHINALERACIYDNPAAVARSLSKFIDSVRGAGIKDKYLSGFLPELLPVTGREADAAGDTITAASLSSDMLALLRSQGIRGENARSLLSAFLAVKNKENALAVLSAGEGTALRLLELADMVKKADSAWVKEARKKGLIERGERLLPDDTNVKVVSAALDSPDAAQRAGMLLEKNVFGPITSFMRTLAFSRINRGVAEALMITVFKAESPGELAARFERLIEAVMKTESPESWERDRYELKFAERVLKVAAGSSDPAAFAERLADPSTLDGVYTAYRTGKYMKEGGLLELALQRSPETAGEISDAAGPHIGCHYGQGRTG